MNYERQAKRRYWKHLRWHPPQKTEWAWIIFLGVSLGLIIATVVLTGCQTDSLAALKKRDDVGFKGVPNLATVDGDSVWRGGQPTEDGWHFLENLGVTNVVKLNTEVEGSDEYAEWAGWTIHRFPITLEQQWVGTGLKEIIPKAVAAIKPGTFVHCGSDSRTRSKLDAWTKTQGGQDRTGLVIAVYRTRTGYTKANAEKEMMAHGFHKILHGLWEYWEDFKP